MYFWFLIILLINFDILARNNSLRIYNSISFKLKSREILLNVMSNHENIRNSWVNYNFTIMVRRILMI